MVVFERGDRDLDYIVGIERRVVEGRWGVVLEFFVMVFVGRMGNSVSGIVRGVWGGRVREGSESILIRRVMGDKVL